MSALTAALAPVVVWAEGGPRVDVHHAMARDEWLTGQSGWPATPAAGTEHLPVSGQQGNYGQVGTLWDGGPSNGSNGVASERATTINGTGGPEGDHAATVVVPFEGPGLASTGDPVVPGPRQLTKRIHLPRLQPEAPASACRSGWTS